MMVLLRSFIPSLGALLLAAGHAGTWGDLRHHQDPIRDPFESRTDQGLVAGREVVLRSVQPVHAAIDRCRDHPRRATHIGILARLGP